MSAFEIKTCQITFSLPPGAKILVKKGDEINIGEILAVKPEKNQEFNLAKILQSPPENLNNCWLIPLATEVKEGQVIAQKKTLLGKKVFKSPVTGTLISLDNGLLKIKISEKEEIVCPVKGEVQEIKNENCLVGEFTANVLTGLVGEGPDNWGEIQILGERQDQIGLNDLSAQVKEKILILGGKISAGLIHKADALEAAGLVGGSTDDTIKVQDLSVLIAGQKDGFVSEEVWHDFHKYQGKRALISGQEKTLKVPL